MADEITERHLNRLRIRGAPATIPGTTGFVGTYDAEEVWLQTSRALIVPLPKQPDAKAIAAAFQKLRQVAVAQNLTIADEPLVALKGDPNNDPPHTWEYEAALPIRGAAKPEADVSIGRIPGGGYIFTMTGRGIGDLKNVYVHLFGRFLPSKKQELLRPYILHRIVEGLDAENSDRLAIAVYVPSGLSIKPIASGDDAGEA